MTQPSFADQITTFNALLGAIETRVAGGEVPRELVADFKSTVDDLRLRLWSVLGTGSANDYRVFQEQFRLRRAKEICLGLEDDGVAADQVAQPMANPRAKPAPPMSR